MHDRDMKSRVHPKYKTKYHVGNWPAYDRALVQRGDIPVWLTPDAVATWDFASRSQISTLWWVRGPWSANRRSMLPLCVSNSQFSRENPPHLCGVSPMWTT